MLPRHFSWLRPLLAALRKSFSGILILSFFINLLALAVPVFVLQVYDRVVFHAGLETLKGLVIGIIILLIFEYSLRQSRTLILQRVALKIDSEVGSRLYQKFIALPLRLLEQKPTSFWQTAFRDVDTVRNTVSGHSAVLLIDLPFVVLAIGLIVALAQPIAWVFLTLLPCFILIAWLSSRVIQKAQKQEKEATRTRDDLIATLINARTTIKAFNMGTKLLPAWEKSHSHSIESAIIRGGKADTYTNLGSTFTMLSTVLLTTFGAIAIINQDLTMGALIATNMLSGRVLGPMTQLVSAWRGYGHFNQAVKRLDTLFDQESERQTSTVTLPRPKGVVRLQDVQFHYDPNQPPLLSNVSLTLHTGITALMGKNGSGKTTLIKLMQGLYPCSEGKISLDGADLQQFSRADLSRWIGYVAQDATVLHGTIHENLTMAAPEVDDETLIKVCQKAGIHEAITALPDGYGTDIGEAGYRLSGGQRQRLTIARALMGNPPLLLLDEPSANLDKQAEDSLAALLQSLSQDHTIFVVTHSPPLLKASQNLAVLDQGRIVLQGPTPEVLARLTPKSAQKRPVQEAGQ